MLDILCSLVLRSEYQLNYFLDLFFPGVSMNIQPMYLGESAPKELRGAVTLTSASFTALGLVLGQVVGLR